MATSKSIARPSSSKSGCCPRPSSSMSKHVLEHAETRSTQCSSLFACVPVDRSAVVVAPARLQNHCRSRETCRSTRGRCVCRARSASAALAAVEPVSALDRHRGSGFRCCCCQTRVTPRSGDRASLELLARPGLSPRCCTLRSGWSRASSPQVQVARRSRLCRRQQREGVPRLSADNSVKVSTFNLLPATEGSATSANLIAEMYMSRHEALLGCRSGGRAILSAVRNSGMLMRRL